MVRTWLVCLAVLAAMAAPAMAQIPCGAIGVGVKVGMMQPTGGDEEFEDSGLIVGLSAMKPLSDRVCISLDYTHGETQNGEALPECYRFSSWGEAEEFKTVWNRADLTAIYNFMPEKKVNPFVSVGLGMTFWEVQDWCESAADQGQVPDGYDTDGKRRKLRGTDLTASLGAGVEFFATQNMSVSLGAGTRSSS